jgi:hypothetical protein
MDANMSDDVKCASHIEWAKSIGLASHEDWYPNGTTTSDADLQCSLYLKAGPQVNGSLEGEGEGHNCTLPACTPISESMMAAGDALVLEQCVRPAPPVMEEGPSIEWWGWVLIVAAVVLLGLVVAWALGLFGPKKPKKKRAVKVEPAPAPEVEVAPPIYTYIAEPVVTSVVQASPTPIYTQMPMATISTGESVRVLVP